MYSKQGLSRLFLACAFLPHVWTYLLVFNDFSTLIVRTDTVWGAIGVMSYGLLFTLVESVFIFIVAALLGVLIAPRWEESRRIAMLGLLAGITMLWAMCSQVYFIWHLRVPGHITRLLARIQNPSGLLYAVALIVVAVTTVVPVILILRDDRFFAVVRAAMERVSWLTGFYLLMDALALIVVIIRNV